MSSSAYILIQSNGYKYTFDGVTGITHTLTLSLASGSDADESSDYIHSAKNEPDTVTLNVVTSDVHGSPQDWSRSMMAAFASMKENRLLCTVATPIRTYTDMLLTDLTVVQDDTTPCGWTGSLTFTHTTPDTTKKEDDNSSSVTYTGQTGTKKVLSPFQQLQSKTSP